MSKQVKLYKFWASWCGPCKTMAPVVARVLAARPNVELVSVDAEDADGLAMATKFGVKSIPHFSIEVDGKVVSEKIGAMPEAVLADWIDRALAG